jgi:hypothetical protein
VRIYGKFYHNYTTKWCQSGVTFVVFEMAECIAMYGFEVITIKSQTSYNNDPSVGNGECSVLFIVV